jgi:hypothetical protein
MVDLRAMAPGYADWSRNNTYGVEVMTKEVAEEYVQTMEDPEQGCFALTDQCRALAAEKDPEHTAQDQDVNQLCAMATGVCFGSAIGFFELSPVSHFMIDELDVCHLLTSTMLVLPL